MWYCVGGGVYQDDLLLSTEVMMQIGHRKEFYSFDTNENKRNRKKKEKAHDR